MYYHQNRLIEAILMCTHYISFSIKMIIILSLQLFDFSKGSKNVETAVVNEPSVFEPLKFFFSVITFP